jgi:RHS repeat-associated protein
MFSQDNASGAIETFTYGNDVHGSVSQLIDDAGQVKASYGYDAYGGSDAPTSDPETLTVGDTDEQAPLNPYRYTGRRMDSGMAASTAPAVPAVSAGYDMGARRFGPDIGRFMQGDMLFGALANLGLALDPLTQNRYALAGGNPISYVEWDGHWVTVDGYGGASPAPAPRPTSTSSGGSGGGGCWGWECSAIANRDSGGSTRQDPCSDIDCVRARNYVSPRSDDIFHQILDGSANDYDNADPINNTDTTGCNSVAPSCILGILMGEAPLPSGFSAWIRDRYKDTKFENNVLISLTIDGRSRRAVAAGTCSFGTNFLSTFRNSCKVHDLGYDLLRFFDRERETYGASGRASRAAVDALFLYDMHHACEGFIPKPGCRTVATIMYAGVTLNSSIGARYGAP